MCQKSVTLTGRWVGGGSYTYREVLKRVGGCYTYREEGVKESKRVLLLHLQRAKESRC